MKTSTLVLAVAVLILLQGCGADTAPATTVPTVAAFSSPSPSFTPSITGTFTPSPSPTPSGPVPAGTLLDDRLKMKVVHPSGVRVNYLATGPDGEVYVIDVNGSTIYQMRENGQLAEYLAFPGMVIDYLNVAPDGTIWFSNGGGIYRVAEGAPQKVADQNSLSDPGSGWVNRIFDFDSAGNLYAVDLPSNDVEKITPDGKVSVVASGFQTWRIGVAPDDRVYIVTFNGELARIAPDGTLDVVATGFGNEDSIAFAPDGGLYVLGWNGLMKVDPATGKVERPAWYERYRGIGGFLAIDRNGVGYIFHPINPLYRMDLAAQSLEMIYRPLGNSYAMTVDPATEDVYVAYGDALPKGRTTVYRVNGEGGLDEVGGVPYGTPVALAFSPDGTGYLAAADNGTGRTTWMIFRFRPPEGAFEEYQSVGCSPSGMAVQPDTGELFWTDCGRILARDAGGKTRALPFFDPGKLNRSTLDFAPDGTLYAALWFRSTAPSQPMQQGIYRYDDGKWALVKDMTSPDPRLALVEFALCPNARLYLSASVDGALLGRDYPSFSAIERLEEDGSLTMIGYDLGDFDPLTLVCAPSGTLYFTNVLGIYSIPGLGPAT